MMRKLVVSAVFLIALAYCIITVPFGGADEFNHFFRAYHVSTGGILAHHDAYGVVGAKLPAGLLTLATQAANFPGVPAIKLSGTQFRSASRIQLKANDRVVTHFPNTALYSPVVYLPPAMGIAVGRLFSAHPLWLFYLARCFSALVVSALLGLAIRTLPPPAGSFAVFPLLPMILFQTAMITADGITIALGLLFAAEILRVRFDPQKFNRPSRFKYLLFAFLLSQLRPPYLLIGLAILAVPPECFSGKADARRFLVLFFVLLIVPFLLWNCIAASLFSQMRPGVTTDPSQQLAHTLQAPSAFLTALHTEFFTHAFKHLRELIGCLGWQNFPLPWLLIIVIAVMLLVCTCSVDTAALRLTWRVRLFFFAIAFAGLIGANLMIYLMWNGIGAAEVAGFQGRYFLPFLPFALIGMANGALKNLRWLSQVAIIACLLSNLFALGLLARATFY